MGRRSSRPLSGISGLTSGRRAEKTLHPQGGWCSGQRTTANACTILDVLERDVPVYAGCDRPLVADPVDASYAHGKDGLGDSGYPPSKRTVSGEHAVHALIHLASASPGELTLVAIGPLTNVALATRLDPALPTKYRCLVVMGGSIRGLGNVTHAAEFNVYADPEAAAIMFDAWPGLTLVSWETALDHGLSAEQVETLLTTDSPRAEFFRHVTQRYIKFVQQFLGVRGLFPCDPLAMAVALEPDIVHKVEARYVQVELAGQHTRGYTAVDRRGQTGREANVNLMLEVDIGRFWELVQAAVR